MPHHDDEAKKKRLARNRQRAEMARNLQDIAGRATARDAMPHVGPQPEYKPLEFGDYEITAWDSNLFAETFSRMAGLTFGQKAYDAAKAFFDVGFREVDAKGKAEIIEWALDPHASYADMPPGAMRYELSAGITPILGDLQAWRDVMRDFHNDEVGFFTALDFGSTLPGAIGAAGTFVGMLRHVDEFADLGKLYRLAERAESHGVVSVKPTRFGGGVQLTVATDKGNIDVFATGEGDRIHVDLIERQDQPLGSGGTGWGGEQQAANTIGRRALVGEVIPTLQEMFPEAKYVIGERVSGSRHSRKAGLGSSHAEAKLPSTRRRTSIEQLAEVAPDVLEEINIRRAGNGLPRLEYGDVQASNRGQRQMVATKDPATGAVDNNILESQTARNNAASLARDLEARSFNAVKVDWNEVEPGVIEMTLTDRNIDKTAKLYLAPDSNDAGMMEVFGHEGIITKEMQIGLKEAELISDDQVFRLIEDDLPDMMDLADFANYLYRGGNEAALRRAYTRRGHSIDEVQGMIDEAKELNAAENAHFAAAFGTSPSIVPDGPRTRRAAVSAEEYDSLNDARIYAEGMAEEGVDPDFLLDDMRLMYPEIEQQQAENIITRAYRELRNLARDESGEVVKRMREEDSVPLFRRTRNPEAGIGPDDPTMPTGNEGAEQARRLANPEGYVTRTPFYRAGTPAEHMFGEYPYEVRARVEGERVYDLNEDPKGYVAEERAREPGPDVITRVERRLKEGDEYDAVGGNGQVWMFRTAEETSRIDRRTGEQLPPAGWTAGNPVRATGRGADALHRELPYAEVTPLDEQIAREMNAEGFGGGTWTLAGKEPPLRERYMVSPSKDTETMIAPGAITPQDIAAFRRAHKHEFDNGGYIGAWKDDNGQLVLDVSRGFTNRNTALNVAMHGDQQSIADRFRIRQEDWDRAFIDNPHYDGQRTVWPNERLKAEAREQTLNAIPHWGDAADAAMLQHMDPVAREFYDNAKPHVQRNIRRMYRLSLPPEEMAAVIALGEQTRGWYTGAADALRQAYGDDAPQFTALLAATSPNIPVTSNVDFATDLWNEWNIANRTTDPEAIRRLYDMVLGGQQGTLTGHQQVPTSFPNVLRVLSNPNPAVYADPDFVLAGAGLSGNKVNPFFPNVMGELARYTNDTHMLTSAPAATNTAGRRAAMSAAVGGGGARLADELGVPPELIQMANSQEMAWEPIRQLKEMAGRGSVEDLLFDADGNLNMETIAELRRRMAGAEDFADLLQRPQTRALIGEAGGNPNLNVERRPGLAGFQEEAAQFAQNRPEALRSLVRRLDMARAGDMMFGLGGAAAAGLLARQAGLLGDEQPHQPISLLR